MILQAYVLCVCIVGHGGYYTTIDEQKLDEQLEPIYNNLLPIQVVAWLPSRCSGR